MELVAEVTFGDLYEDLMDVVEAVKRAFDYLCYEFEKIAKMVEVIEVMPVVKRKEIRQETHPEKGRCSLFINRLDRVPWYTSGFK